MLFRYTDDLRDQLRNMASRFLPHPESAPVARFEKALKSDDEIREEAAAQHRQRAKSKIRPDELLGGKGGAR